MKAALWWGEAEPLLVGNHHPEGRLRLAATGQGVKQQHVVRSGDLTSLHCYSLDFIFRKCI